MKMEMDNLVSEEYSTLDFARKTLRLSANYANQTIATKGFLGPTVMLGIMDSVHPPILMYYFVLILFIRTLISVHVQ